MIKVTIEENGKVINTMTGDIAIGFVAEDDTNGKGGIKNCIFVSGAMGMRHIITSLSFLCIEVINALSNRNGLIGELQMHLFKKTLKAAQSGEKYKVERVKEVIKTGGEE